MIILQGMKYKSIQYEAVASLNNKLKQNYNKEFNN